MGSKTLYLKEVRDALLHGDSFIAEYVRFASRQTGANSIYHLNMAKLCISTVINRNVWLETGFRTYPNLWILLLGASSNSLKSTSLDIATEIISSVGRPHTEYESRTGEGCNRDDEGKCTRQHNFLLPPSFSYEGLFDELAARPSGVLIYDEFISLLTSLDNNYNKEGMSFMTSLYGCPAERKRKTKTGGLSYIKHAYLNIGACSTIDWLSMRIKEDHFRGGFLPRIFYVVVKEPPPLKKVFDLITPSQTEINHLVNKLRTVMDKATQISGAMQCDKNAQDLYGKFEEKIYDLPPAIEALHSRYRIYGLKLAMIYALNGGRGVISAVDMENAIYDVDEAVINIADMFISGRMGFSQHQKDVNRIIDLIKQMGGKVKHGELLCRANIRADEFRKLIDTLIESGRIECVVVDSLTKKGKVYQVPSLSHTP